MNQQQVMYRVKNIIEEVKTAVLASVDKEGIPHMRWMSPVILDEHPHHIYAVTSQKSNKANNFADNYQVEWMVQSLTLSTIFNLRGFINLIENPSLKAQVLEAVSGNLNVYWKINENLDDSVVLETVILEIKYFDPIKGSYEIIKIDKG